MMEVAVPRSWKEQFRLAAQDRAEDLRWRERMAQSTARQQERRAVQAETEKRKAEHRAALMQVFAPPERIEAFTRKLDRYDTATVEALMENRIVLDKVRERVDELLTKAHVLPDGRRVFKTHDGTRVFDEHGAELRADVVHPDAIDDRKPTWETFKATHDEKLRLELERRELLDYQSRLDDARERVGKDRITEKALDDLGADLDKEMPDAIRRRVVRDKPDPSAEADRASPSSPTPASAREDALSARSTAIGPALQ